MSRPPRAAQDPFSPVERIISALYALMWYFVVLTFVVGIGHAFGQFRSVGVYQFSDFACVPVNDAFSLEAMEHLVRPGARVLAQGSMVCLDHPTWTQCLAASTAGILGTVEVLGACFLVRGFIRAGRAQGLFAPEVARRLERLGWFLAAMSVVTPAIGKLANGLLVSSVATPKMYMWSHWWAFLVNDPQPEWMMLIVGLGVLSFARIMRRAVALQEEAALTV